MSKTTVWEALKNEYESVYPFFFDEKTNKKGYIKKAARKAARKSSRAGLPIKMLRYAANNISNSFEYDGVFGLLVTKGCKEYYKEIRDSFTHILFAIENIPISEEDYQCILEFVSEVLFENNWNEQGLSVLRIIYAKCRNYDKELISDCIDNFYLNIEYGRIVRYVDFKQITSFARVKRLYDFEYGRYDEAKEIINKRKDQYDFISRLLPDLCMNIDNPLDNSCDDILFFSEIEQHAPWDIDDYLGLNYEVILRKCLSESASKTNSKKNNDILIGVLFVLLNLTPKSELCSYYFGDKHLKSLVDANYDHLVPYLGILTQYLFFNERYDRFKAFIYQIKNAVKRSENRNIYLEHFEDGSFKVFELSEDDLILNTDRVLELYNKAQYLEKALPFVTRDEHSNYSEFSVELKEIKADLDDIVALKKIVNEILNDDLWEENTRIPNTLVYSYAYPDRWRGDIVEYISQKYGTVTQLSIHKKKAVIKGITRNDLHYLLEAIRGNDLQEQTLYKVLQYHKPEKIRTHVFRNGYTYSLSETKDLSDGFYSYWLHTKNKLFSLYTKIVEEGKATPKWISEYKVYLLVKSLYPDALYQYHADWLGAQSLDVFIPSLSVGIEYQGEQHYEPIRIFGGKVGYESTKERDLRKKEKCKKHGIILIEWKYSEEISIETLKHKLSQTKTI